MDLVDETLRDWRRHPHQYGINDCVLSAAAYFVKAGSALAMPSFTGTYDNNDDAMLILAEYGGMASMMEFVGGAAIDGPPERGGFIGLLADADYVIPCLCTGDNVAARLERGVIEVRLRLVAWRGVWRPKIIKAA